MNDLPEYKRPRKRPKAVAFLLACAGLLFVNAAADSVVAAKVSANAWLLLGAGIALLASALWWALG